MAYEANRKKETRLKHVRVYDQLYRLIQEGVFPAGSQLPSEPVLAGQLSVSRMTLRRALALLQEDHLVKNIRGKGNFICAPSSCTPPLETGKARHPIYSCCAQPFGEVELEFRIEPPTEAITQSLGQKSAAVVIAVYGNRDYDDTLLEMKDILTERGFTVIAGLAAIAQHSIAPSIAAGRPDEKDRHELREAARAIWEKLEDLAAPADGQVEVKGKRKEYGGSAMKPTADENCVGCGTCAEQCPVKAIPAEAPNTTDRERCISCMRCIKVCPAGARKLDPAGIAAVEQRLSKICGERKENELYI